MGVGGLYFILGNCVYILIYMYTVFGVPFLSLAGWGQLYSRTDAEMLSLLSLSLSYHDPLGLWEREGERERERGGWRKGE